MEYVMSETTGKRVRISRKKPEPKPVMTMKMQRSAIFELLDVQEDRSGVSILSSSKNLLKNIEDMTETRKDMGKVEWVTHDKLLKNLQKCADLEEELKQYGLAGSHSPSLFLNKIQSGADDDLKYETLIEAKETAKKDLEHFIQNSKTDKAISGDSVTKFKSEIQRLISLQENYHYLEATQGFFCFEVLSAYHSSLTDAVESLSKPGKSVH